MSTKAAGLRRLGATAVSAVLAGCTASAGPAEFSHFNALHLGPQVPASQVQAEQPPAAVGNAAKASIIAAQSDPQAAARRVDAYLVALGFTAEDSRDGLARMVTATRMGEPKRLEAEAACDLQAMRRPAFSAANLTVRLAPAAGSVEVAVQSSFVEVNTNLLSGVLVRERCHSRGVVERGVRRAALGG